MRQKVEGKSEDAPRYRRVPPWPLFHRRQENPAGCIDRPSARSLGGILIAAQNDALGNGDIHRVHGMAPCGGRRRERKGRHGLGPGHGVEIEHVGVAVGLSAAALATKDDEPAQGGVIPDGRVHQRRRTRARTRNLEPLQPRHAARARAVVSERKHRGDAGRGGADALGGVARALWSRWLRARDTARG